MTILRPHTGLINFSHNWWSEKWKTSVIPCLFFSLLRQFWLLILKKLLDKIYTNLYLYYLTSNLYKISYNLRLPISQQNKTTWSRNGHQKSLLWRNYLFLIGCLIFCNVMCSLHTVQINQLSLPPTIDWNAICLKVLFQLIESNSVLINHRHFNNCPNFNNHKIKNSRHTIWRSKPFISQFFLNLLLWGDKHFNWMSNVLFIVKLLFSLSKIF